MPLANNHISVDCVVFGFDGEQLKVLLVKQYRYAYGKLLLEIPALLILNWLFPLYGLAYAQFIAECILSLAAVLVLRRLFHRLESQPRPSP